MDLVIKSVEDAQEKVKQLETDISFWEKECLISLGIKSSKSIEQHIARDKWELSAIQHWLKLKQSGVIK